MARWDNEMRWYHDMRWWYEMITWEDEMRWWDEMSWWDEIMKWDEMKLCDEMMRWDDDNTTHNTRHPHNTQHTAHNTPHTTQYTPHTTHHTPHTTHHTQHTAYNTQHTTHHTPHTTNHTLDPLDWGAGGMRAQPVKIRLQNSGENARRRATYGIRIRRATHQAWKWNEEPLQPSCLENKAGWLEGLDKICPVRCRQTARSRLPVAFKCGQQLALLARMCVAPWSHHYVGVRKVAHFTDWISNRRLWLLKFVEPIFSPFFPINTAPSKDLLLRSWLPYGFS